MEAVESMASLALNEREAGLTPHEGEPDPQVDLDNLYPALVECFGIILVGYLAARFNLVSEVEARGINTFISTFSLPALIFGSLCKLNLGTVNWAFLGAIFLAKAVLFFVVLIGAMLALRPHDPARAGLYSIFVTQSNDFALGFPILAAIYGKTHPECPMYVYLLAPISLVILNPIGFVFMEVGKAGRDHQDRTSLAARSITVLKNVTKNPIVFMTAFGVAGNFLFHGALPDVLDRFLSTLGSAFSASALFLLGIRMMGNSRTVTQKAVIVPAILIILKIVAMPIIARELVHQLVPISNDSEHLESFAFIYGTFPAAPTVFVFACTYDIDVDLIATAMVLSTVIAAPLMFISARLLSITGIDPKDYIEQLDRFLLDISVIGLIATAWVTFVFSMTKKWRRSPHFLTMSLVVCQGIGCVGAILWSVINCTHGWKLYLQFIVFAYGVYASRINTALLALAVLLLQVKPTSFLVQNGRLLVVVGLLSPAFLVLALLIVVDRETSAHGAKTDPNFQYGTTQAYVALGVLVLSFLVTVSCMILTQRYRKRRSSLIATPDSNVRVADESRRRLLDSNPDTEDELPTTPAVGSSSEQQRATPDEENLIAIEDLVVPSGPETCADLQRVDKGTGRRRYRCDTEHRVYCDTLLETYDTPPAVEAVDHAEAAKGPDEHQLFRHMCLLLLLATSMFIGIALCIWTLVMERMSGIYLELVFLDGFLNFGQGLFALALFGFEPQYVAMPIRRLYRRWRYGAESLVLPQWEDLEPETKHICQQFLKHHIDKCMESVVKDIRCRLVSHKAVFRGVELVDWLLEVGLAHDRTEAVTYGRQLVKGRVIRHVDNHLDFYDDCFIYTFTPSRP